MLKKFSIVTVFGNEVDEDEEIFLPGFCEIEDLGDSEVFFDIMSEIPTSETVDIEIEHCILLEKPYIDGEVVNLDNSEDISEIDLEALLDDFDMLLEDDYIFCKESITFDLEGSYVDEEELIEEVISFDEEPAGKLNLDKE